MQNIFRYSIIIVLITFIIGSLLSVLFNEFSFLTYAISFIYTIFITLFSVTGIKLYQKISLSSSTILNYIFMGVVFILSSSLGTLTASRIVSKLFNLSLAGLQSLLLMNILFTIVIGTVLVAGVKLYRAYQNAEFNLRKKEIETLKLEKEKAEAELKFYQSQLNPHFLFNTLNTLAGLIQLDPEQAERMIEVLSDYYRSVLTLSNEMIIPLKNEIEFIKNYLKLLKIRFGERLVYSIELNEKCLNFPVPALILQPIVENSVKHGNRQNNGNTHIHIHATLKTKYDKQILVVQVRDNGPGFDSIPHENSSGLSITYKKLRLLYKDEASIDVKNDNGAVVTITIPYIKGGGLNENFNC